MLSKKEGTHSWRRPEAIKRRQKALFKFNRDNDLIKPRHSHSAY